jgi:hypothetical protein
MPFPEGFPGLSTPDPVEQSKAAARRESSAAKLALDAEVDRGDPRAIEDAENRLGLITDADSNLWEALQPSTPQKENNHGSSQEDN